MASVEEKRAATSVGLRRWLRHRRGVGGSAPRGHVLYRIAPFVVAVVVLRPIPAPFTNVRLMLAATVAGLALMTLSRRPVLAMRLLLGGLAFSNIVLAWMHKVGVPASIVRPAGYWKELVIAAVVVVAIRRIAANPRPVDVVDRLVIGYLALSTVYVLDPGLVTDSGSSLGLFDQLLAWRADVLYLILFLAARHARFRSDDLIRMVKALLVAMSVVAALAAFEFFFTDRWREFLVFDIDYPSYLSRVIGSSDDSVAHVLQRLRARVLEDLPRVGSTEITPNALAFPLLVALAFAVEALVQGVLRRVASSAVLLVGAAMLFTQTRSVLLGAVVVLVLSARALPGRVEVVRVRAQVAVTMVLVAVMPLVVIAGLTGRFGGSESETSDQLHITSLQQGFGEVVTHPLGQGLQLGARGRTDLVFAHSENQYLNAGVQLGVVGMVLYVAMIVAIIRLLHRRAEQLGGGPECFALLGARAAMIGLAVVGLFLQPYLSFVPAWFTWGLAGAALGSADRLLAGSDPRSESASDRHRH